MSVPGFDLREIITASVKHTDEETAEEYTRKYAEEMGLQRAQAVTREVVEDLANDEMESVVAVDRDTGEIIFVRYGDEDSVALQEEQRKLAEGRNIVLIHNHWNNTGASLADLGAADWLDAERMVVVTPSGKRYYYHRRGGRLVALKPVQGSGVAAESDPVETAVARLLHMMQSAREAGNPAEMVMLQDHPAVIANADVNVNDVPRYDELARFVTPNMERAAYLKSLKDQAVEQPEIIQEYLVLLEEIFGYNVEFKQEHAPESAIEQVYNLASILFHFLNDLGINVMRSTPDKTNYYLGADDELRVLHETEQPEYRGHVALPESADARLEDVYLGSLITRGAIAHEVSHEIDRRAGAYGTVRVELEFGPDGKVVSRESEEGPKGSFHWYLKNRVLNQQQQLPLGHILQGYGFDTAVSNLNENSRAAIQAELGAVREIFADLLAAKVLDPLDEDFYSTAYDNAEPIGFENFYGAADIAIAMEQYFDHYADYLQDGSPKPGAFDYIKYHDGQKYDELQWPVIPIHGDEE